MNSDKAIWLLQISAFLEKIGLKKDDTGTSLLVFHLLQAFGTAKGFVNLRGEAKTKKSVISQQIFNQNALSQKLKVGG